MGQWSLLLLASPFPWSLTFRFRAGDGDGGAYWDAGNPPLTKWRCSVGGVIRWIKPIGDESSFDSQCCLSFGWLLAFWLTIVSRCCSNLSHTSHLTCEIEIRSPHRACNARPCSRACTEPGSPGASSAQEGLPAALWTTSFFFFFWCMKISPLCFAEVFNPFLFCSLWWFVELWAVVSDWLTIKRDGAYHVEDLQRGWGHAFMAALSLPRCGEADMKSSVRMFRDN